MQTDTEYSDERIPLGYLITFRSYGTWLHGRDGSIDRFHNVYGTPKLPADEKRKQYNRRLLKEPPVKLTPAQRAAILAAVKETCEIRKWELWASNIRSNHVPRTRMLALHHTPSRKSQVPGPKSQLR